MSRKRLLCALLTLCLLILGGFVWYLSTFDLNRYRQTLEEHLSAALHRPVQLGEAHLTLHRGVSVAFSHLQVGTSGEDELFRAGHLLLHLDLWPLLQKKLQFSRILLRNPEVTLDLDRLSESPAPPSSETAGPKQLSTLIRSLEIENGRLLLRSGKNQGETQEYRLEDLQATLTDFEPGASGWLRISGQLSRGSASSKLILVGDVVPPRDLRTWRDLRLKAGLILESFTPQLLPLNLPESIHLQGGSPLRITLEGSPSTGVQMSAEVEEGLFLEAPALSRPLPLPAVSARGYWTSSAAEERLDSLQLLWGEQTLDGAIFLRQGDDASGIAGSFSGEDLPLDPLLAALTATSETFRTSPRALLRRVAVDFALPSGKSQGGGSLRAEALLEEGEANLQEVGRLEQVRLSARFAQNLLEFEGEGRLDEVPLQIMGALDRPFSHRPEVIATLIASVPSGKIRKRLPEGVREGLQLQGPIPARIDLEGPLGEVRLDLRADMDQLAAQWQEKFTKPTGVPADLFLTGRITAETLHIDHSLLRASPFELRLQGDLEPSAAGAMALHFDLSADLEEAQAALPLLKSLRARGGINIRGEIGRQQGQSIALSGGEIFLNRAGLSLGNVLADLNRITGTIRFSESRLETAGLTVRLGSSPIQVEGHLDDFSDPRAELRVRGRSIRADELIFPSPKAVLRDVDGTLRFEEGQLLFAPVTVRLEGGTRATVRGSVSRLGSLPLVELDIASDYGNIDEVIALWSDAPRKSPPSEGGKVEVRITARAAEGQLGNLHFRNAEGLITAGGGVLSISPLHFEAGPGRCDGRVVVEPRPEGSWLKVSGHLEDFDASSIHREMLERRGLVSGVLQGDFHLEGMIGEEFLHTSSGGFNVEIRDGVLRKFRSLARIFSLLNISQIFSLHLPDMAREGMPFNALTASIGMNGGVLSTENLFIDSHAMNLSLVGSLDLNREEVDLVLGVKPLRTVDKIVTNIPLAGWLLTGEEKALLTAHFLLQGDVDDPQIVPVPITSVSEKVVGIFRRVFGLPARVIDNIQSLMDGSEEPKPAPE